MKNINVSIKLAVGIGAILLLIVILAASTLYNTERIVVRGNNTQMLSQIQNASQDLIVASDELRQTVDDQHQQRVQALLKEMRETSAKVKGTLTEPRSLANIDSLLTQIDSFEAAFEIDVKSLKDRAANLSIAVNSGSQANALFDQIKTLLNGTVQQPILHENSYSAISARLAADLVTARTNVAYRARVFLMEGNEKSLQGLNESFAALQKISQQLEPRLSTQASTLLNDAMVSVEAYMDVLRHADQLNKTEAETSAVMHSIYENMRSNIQEVIDIQTSFRAQVVSRAQSTSIFLTVIAIIVGALIGWLIVRQITVPLNQAVRIAQAIGNRDMSNTHIEQRNDEFGTLLKALGQTRSNLSEALGEVSGITTQLAAAAEQLSIVTNQTSAGVNNQRIETEQVATAMNEMSATVQEVAQNAEEAAAAAQKADQQAKSGNQALQVALTDIDQLSQDVHQSAEAIQRLNQDSTSIGTVLTVINSIAEQTNLLALNAAIEAARAGEAGRGFAVVADEVRSLAHRTQESIAQIEELIANLQQGSQNAVRMMDSSSSLAHLTVEHAQQAGEELAAIMRTVSEIQAMNIQIATAAEEQSAVAEEINASVVNVNNIADQSAAAVEETSASSAELARLGQSLQNLVARFKI